MTTPYADQHTAEPARTKASDATCGRALCGWSPASLPADTSLKRAADIVRVGNVAAVGVLVVVIGLLNLAPHLSLRPSLAVDGLAALVAGGWCSLNFWRCRHAHCLITGPGWIALGAFAFIEAGLGHSVIGGNEQVVFLAVLGAALAFEAAWYLWRHTNAIMSA